MNLPLVAAERVLVLEGGAADVTNTRLLLVGSVNMTLAAQLRAEWTDEFASVAVCNVLSQVSFTLKHFVAL